MRRSPATKSGACCKRDQGGSGQQQAEEHAYPRIPQEIATQQRQPLLPTAAPHPAMQLEARPESTSPMPEPLTRNRRRRRRRTKLPGPAEDLARASADPPPSRRLPPPSPPGRPPRAPQRGGASEQRGLGTEKPRQREHAREKAEAGSAEAQLGRGVGGGGGSKDDGVAARGCCFRLTPRTDRPRPGRIGGRRPASGVARAASPFSLFSQPPSCRGGEGKKGRGRVGEGDPGWVGWCGVVWSGSLRLAPAARA
jgi:hypothetical protein